MATLKLGVLGSGSGSNMQSIMDAIGAGTLDAEIKIVLSDVKDAYILERAAKGGIENAYLDCAPWKTKLEGEAEDRCISILKEQAEAPRRVPEPRLEHPPRAASGVPGRRELEAGARLRVQGGGRHGAFRGRGD